MKSTSTARVLATAVLPLLGCGAMAADAKAERVYNCQRTALSWRLNDDVYSQVQTLRAIGVPKITKQYRNQRIPRCNVAAAVAGKLQTDYSNGRLPSRIKYVGGARWGIGPWSFQYSGPSVRHDYGVVATHNSEIITFDLVPVLDTKPIMGGTDNSPA